MREGMPQDELRATSPRRLHAARLRRATSACSSASTPRSRTAASTPQKLHEGDVVMIDDGVRVEGYQSDITRTVVFGKPTQRQSDVWNLEKRAQTAAFNAIKIGAPCEASTPPRAR